MGIEEKECIKVNDIGEEDWIIQVGMVGWKMENKNEENEKRSKVKRMIKKNKIFIMRGEGEV